MSQIFKLLIKAIFFFAPCLFNFCGSEGPSNTPCTQDLDCPAKEVCRDGRCAAGKVCSDHFQCPAGTACVRQSCRSFTPSRAPCFSNDECAVQEGEACRGGECRSSGGSSRECEDDFACPSAEICSAGVCRPAFASNRLCGKDADCPEREMCFGGQCSFSGSGSGRRCVDGFDCPPAEICQEGECAASEEGGLFCYSTLDCMPEDSCQNTACRPAAGSGRTCSSDEDCPSGEACAAGICGLGLDGMTCSGVEQCFDGQMCVDGVCVTQGDGNPCEEDGQCREGHACMRGRCAALGMGWPCVEDQECAQCVDDPESGEFACDQYYYCIDGYCGPAGDMIFCSSGADCPDGRECGDGRCLVVGEGKSCGEDADCVHSLKCSDGACRPVGVGTVCGDISDCVPGLVCGPDGACVFSSPGGCTADSDCSARGGSCVSGRCAIARRCSDEYDCGAGRSCVDGACVPSSNAGGACVTGSDCPAGMNCSGGRCVEGGDVRPPEGVVECGEDETAAGECPPGVECVEGMCSIEISGRKRSCADFSSSCIAPVLQCFQPSDMASCSGDFTDLVHMSWEIDYSDGAIYKGRISESGLEFEFEDGELCFTAVESESTPYSDIRGFEIKDQDGGTFYAYLGPGEEVMIACPSGERELYAGMERCRWFPVVSPDFQMFWPLDVPCGLPFVECDANKGCEPGLACCIVADDEIQGEGSCDFEELCDR